jgi:hypothetical protein
LVWQGEKVDDKEKIKKIWSDIVSKEWKWNNLKPKFEELLNLGGNLLPLIWRLKYDEIEIEIYDGQSTFNIVAENNNKLKEFKEAIEKNAHERLSPNAIVSFGKVILNDLDGKVTK